MAGDEVDMFMEKYLSLLHDYSMLRTELSNLQTGIFQNIARANYSAERGMRYGQDYYDDRMQASRRAIISVDEQGLPEYRVSKDPSLHSAAETPELSAADVGPSPIDTSGDEGIQTKAAKKQPRKDPLQWFGILTPMSLRTAQIQGVRMVEDIIPRLVSVNAEMAHVEIEVRRARKKRTKAAARMATTQQESVPSRERLA